MLATPSMQRSVWIGWDAREAAAFAVARHSLTRRMTTRIPVHGLVAADLRRRRVLTRPLEYRERGTKAPSVMWDVISDAPQSTEHANARFLVPLLAPEGWALFMDGDVLVREDIAKLFDELDPKYAVYCVKHHHVPDEAVKMDAQIQTSYSRKNWSSMMAFNVGHPANAALTQQKVNSLPGRDLHRFCWLEDRDIGSLDVAWNYLVGISNSRCEPKLVHFTLGVPDMPGYEDCLYAAEWRHMLEDWATGH